MNHRERERDMSLTYNKNKGDPKMKPWDKP